MDFALVAGACCLVNFKYKTFTGSFSTLSINSTGAKYVRYYYDNKYPDNKEMIEVSTSSGSYRITTSPVLVVYDGSAFSTYFSNLEYSD